MGYVKIRVISEGSSEDFQRWYNHMLEEPKCWNKFCLGCFDKKELQAVHVVKEDNERNSYITTLCEDCIHTNRDSDILVNEKHLMVEIH